MTWSAIDLKVALILLSHYSRVGSIRHNKYFLYGLSCRLIKANFYHTYVVCLTGKLPRLYAGPSALAFDVCICPGGGNFAQGVFSGEDAC